MELTRPGIPKADRAQDGFLKAWFGQHPLRPQADGLGWSRSNLPCALQGRDHKEAHEPDLMTGKASELDLALVFRKKRMRPFGVWAYNVGRTRSRTRGSPVRLRCPRTECSAAAAPFKSECLDPKGRPSIAQA